MKHFIIGCLLLSTTIGFSQKMKPIFNGKNLKGWEEPENNLWWTIEEGVLHGKSDPDLKGSIMWTKKVYKDFIIETDFKFGEGIVDSGIFLRDISQQIQLGISGSMKRDMTCSPYIQGKGYPVEASNIKKLLKQDDWNTMRVKVQGSTYTVWLNGEQVMTYTSDTALPEGKVGVQVHPNNDMHIYFKNLKLAEI